MSRNDEINERLDKIHADVRAAIEKREAKDVQYERLLKFIRQIANLELDYCQAMKIAKNILDKT